VEAVINGGEAERLNPQIGQGLAGQPGKQFRQGTVIFQRQKVFFILSEA
jgi:hypothetical protein